MELPCKDLFDKLEAEKKIMEKCWDLADSRQWKLTSLGLGGVRDCVFCVERVAKAIKSKKKKDIALAILKCADCGKGVAGFVSGLFAFSVFLDSCNDQDEKAAAVAEEYRKCSEEHKDVLNAAARANS